jgi:eukaryotic-like serine/threonine-protein kinase
MLYELLTGRPPFRGATAMATLHDVLEAEPVAPRKLKADIPPDLETICLKCLEKDPARRYSDVTALAEDLRRFQAGKPIVARPVSQAERLWRWCLRNKGVAALGAAVALLLLIVTAVSAVAALTVNRKNQALENANVALGAARNKAEERRLEAETKQKLAEKAARAANQQNRSAVDAEVELIGLLENKLRYVPALQDVREQMLERATKNLDAAARAMTDLRRDIGWNPEDEGHNWRSLARAHQRLGDLSLSLNRFKDAMERLRRAEAILETLAAANPGDLMTQMFLGRMRRQLGFVAVNRIGDSEAGLQYLHKAVEIHRACLAVQPDNDLYKSELANSVGQLAFVEMLLGHLEKAHELYLDEEKLRESFSPAAANQEENRRQLSGLYERFAELKIRLHQPEEGRRLYDRCAALRAEVVAERPDFWPAVFDLARSYNNAAFLRFPQGREPAAAREYHKKALALIDKRSTADPTNLDNKAMLAETLYYEATCALYAGDIAGSAAGYRRCLEIRRALVTEPGVKVTQVDLMVALARCGEHTEAAEIAVALVATPPTDTRLYFQAACGFALSAGAASGDPELVELYTSLAIDCLRDAKKRGWSDPESLETDPDLEPIRNDPAFRALQVEFRRRAQKLP